MEVPGPTTETTSNTGNEISRDSIFGLFLTMSLCLLSQPYGSFLCRPASGRFGGLIFGFWRLLPIACFWEAIIIFHVACQTTWTKSDSSRSILSGYQSAAIALLLLRADKKGEDGTYIIDKLINEQSGQLQPPTTDADTGELEDIEASNVSIPVPASAYQHPLGHFGSVSRRTTFEPISSFSARNSDLSYDLVRQAIGSNALAYREILVDLVTISSVITVTLKLATFTLPAPWWLNVRIPLISYICGWCSVQLLLVLLRCREVSSESQMKTIVEETRRLYELRYPQGRDEHCWAHGILNGTFRLPILIFTNELHFPSNHWVWWLVTGLSSMPITLIAIFLDPSGHIAKGLGLADRLMADDFVYTWSLICG
ncbi:hypothetical protein QBC35DRAFT_462016 [Podospora australis]|uniref:Uncharacterized protein n=1 Tax=Podospora australis TaxID=1536484 RepID=A0AAN6WWJ9_9PEZI|nr:hypothetical protein QBC35DRAFT_462016 [Podospora australis]